jgi:hypothetical protein
MIGLTAVFWVFIIIFALIGMMRGWAKELIVTFAVILAIFIISVIERFAPFIEGILTSESAASGVFWLRSIILLLLVFFGYQTPTLPRFAGSGKFARDRLQDSLLGLFLGVLNGYLVVGTIWYYLDQAGYPYPNIIQAPLPDTEWGQAALRIISLLPPTWMGPPAIYFAVALAFVFVLVVFI